MKTKTYSRQIFSGKNVSFRGMRDGDGALYKSGFGVEFCMNLYWDGALLSRRGGNREEKYENKIHLVHIDVVKGLSTGDEIWSEA